MRSPTWLRHSGVKTLMPSSSLARWHDKCMYVWLLTQFCWRNNLWRPRTDTDNSCATPSSSTPSPHSPSSYKSSYFLLTERQWADVWGWRYWVSCYDGHDGSGINKWPACASAFAGVYKYICICMYMWLHADTYIQIYICMVIERTHMRIRCTPFIIRRHGRKDVIKIDSYRGLLACRGRV